MNGDTQICMNGREYKIPGDLVTNQQIVEIWNELQRCGMFPSASAPEADLEALLELQRRVKLDLYSQLGPSLLGVSRFVTGRRPNWVSRGVEYYVGA